MKVAVFWIAFSLTMAATIADATGYAGCALVRPALGIACSLFILSYV